MPKSHNVYDAPFSQTFYSSNPTQLFPEKAEGISNHTPSDRILIQPLFNRPYNPRLKNAGMFTPNGKQESYGQYCAGAHQPL